jgi:tetrahydromethanopterin S-methyltransferase subunit H
MYEMGEYNNAILALVQASEFFQNEYEIEYRLAGLHHMLNENEKGNYHLVIACTINFKNHTILKDLFPQVWDKKEVQDYIQKHTKLD